jgi:hypothetical protein
MPSGIIGEYQVPEFKQRRVLSFEINRDLGTVIYREQHYNCKGEEVENRIVVIPAEFRDKAIEALKEAKEIKP